MQKGIDIIWNNRTLCLKITWFFAIIFKDFGNFIVSEINVIVQIFYLHGLIGRYVTSFVGYDVTSKLKNKRIHKLKQ